MPTHSLPIRSRSVNVTAGTVRKLTSGPSTGKYQATVILGEGRGAKKRTKTFDTPKAAKAWQHETKAGGLPSGDAAEQTLAQAFDAYTAANVLRPNTAKHYAVVRDHVVRSGLGGRKLAKLVPSAQNEFTAWMVREGFAGSTVNVYADKLNAVLCFAAADGGLAFTPKAAKVDHRPEDVPAIALADVRALYEAAPERFAPAILLGAFCGLRASEAAAVTVADVDWTAGTVRVSKAVDARGQYDRTKTKRSVRTVPVPANVLAQLEPHRFRAPDANLAVNGRGRRLTTHSVGRAFGVAADDAALGDVTFHALRKFFATSLLARGVNPKAVAQWLGDSVTTMMARYALVQPTDADIARAAIAATFDAVAAA